MSRDDSEVPVGNGHHGCGSAPSPWTGRDIGFYRGPGPILQRHEPARWSLTGNTRVQIVCTMLPAKGWTVLVTRWGLWSKPS